MARSLDLSRGWPIPYDPTQRTYQRPSQAIFSQKRPNGHFIKASWLPALRALNLAVKGYLLIGQCPWGMPGQPGGTWLDGLARQAHLRLLAAGARRAGAPPGGAQCLGFRV